MNGAKERVRLADKVVKLFCLDECIYLWLPCDSYALNASLLFQIVSSQTERSRKGKGSVNSKDLKACEFAISSDSEVDSEEEGANIKKKIKMECAAEAALLNSILAQPLRSKKRGLGVGCVFPMTTIL